MTDPTGHDPAAHPEERHLDLDALADHLAGEVDASAHLSGCGGCTARLAELTAADRPVVRALQGLADPPLPDDVTDRLAAALAGEPPLAGQTSVPQAAPLPAAVVPLAARRRRPTWLPAVAAGVVLVAGGLLVAQLVGRPAGLSSDTSTASRVAAGAAEDSTAPSYPTLASGLDYTDAAAVAAALPSVLDGSAGAASTPPEQLAADPLARLREPAALADCLAALLDPGVPDQRPLALDYATYRGAPALAVVLPDPDPTRVSVFVVGPDCSRADDDVQFFTRVDRP